MTALTKTPDLTEGLVTEIAKRGQFQITVTEKGSIDSMKNGVLTSKVEGSTTIIWIVPEGTSVKAGDLVCELDASLLSDRETQQEILAERAKTALDQGKEDLIIQEIANKSETEAAALRRDLAIIDLEKFVKGDFVQQKKELDSQLTIATENYLRSQESYTYIQRMVKNGYKSQNDLESERIARDSQEINVKLAQGKMDVLIDYTHPRTVKELEAKVEECEREIQRTESRTKSALIQKEAELHARQLTHEVEHNKHERLLTQIKACKIYATQDGQVVYANTRDGRSNDQVLIEVGAAVRERQPIINLPDLDNMKVNARIHESRISMVRPGMSATVKVDAFADQAFHGVVDSVASVPSSTGSFGSSIKEYDAVIRLIDETEKVNKLRPGLNASAEILVERRDDVLQIPVQANFTIGSKQFVYVVNGKSLELREIKVGKTNSNFLEILEGLKDEEQVVMNPQSRFKKEISDLEEKLAEAEAKAPAKAPDAAIVPGVIPPTNAAPAASPVPTAPGQPGPAGAQPGAPSTEGRPGGNMDPMARFTQMDKDQNGKISKDEAEGRFAENFDSFDADSDGSVTKEEFLAAAAKFRGGRGGRPRNTEASGN